jgi:hypothetical protein
LIETQDDACGAEIVDACGAEIVAIVNLKVLVCLVIVFVWRLATSVGHHHKTVQATAMTY